MNNVNAHNFCTLLGQLDQHLNFEQLSHVARAFWFYQRAGPNAENCLTDFVNHYYLVPNQPESTLGTPPDSPIVIDDDDDVFGGRRRSRRRKNSIRKKTSRKSKTSRRRKH